MATDLSTAPPLAPSLPTMHLTPSKKRNCDGEIVTHSTLTPSVEQKSSPLSHNQSPTASQDPSDQSTPLTDLGTTPSVSPEKPPAMAPADSKKRKLTAAEKAIKQAEKEEKDREKAEAKAKKDEEKKRKEEEREAARKVKDEKKQAKEAEKQKKEAEKQKKEAEALKKERAQIRISSFFAKPAASSISPVVSDYDNVSRGTTPSRRNSIASVDLDEPLVEINPSPAKRTNPEEKPFIMPFFVKEHVEVAPFNRFLSSSAFRSVELPLNQDVAPEKINIRFQKRRRARQIKPVKHILSEISGSETSPIDLEPLISLEHIPYKYLFYREDVRPPYRGTYSRTVSPRAARKLAINPLYRGLPDTNYDYDSEAEWAEPEEGDEEVLDDDEKSEDEDGDEEMDDFLDDEGDVVKRPLVVGDLQPQSSGLCWENGGNQPQNGFDLTLYRMDVLHDSTTFPIDPFSTVHWSDIGKKSPPKREEQSQQSASMHPPRPPLMAVDPNGGNLMPPANPFACSTSSGKSENTHQKTKANAASSGKVVKLIPSELLPAMKTTISGSTLSKVGLIEVLKAEYPKCSKDAIKHTLERIAERRDKKWVLL